MGKRKPHSDLCGYVRSMESRHKRHSKAEVLRQEVELIRDVASGELQVATTDTEGLRVVEEKARAALEAYDADAPNPTRSGGARSASPT